MSTNAKKKKRHLCRFILSVFTFIAAFNRSFGYVEGHLTFHGAFGQALLNEFGNKQIDQ
jgi:hypothetical protein